MTSELYPSEPLQDEAVPKRRFVPQWNLSTLLLLTAAVAVWVAYFHFCYQIPRLEREIAPMRRMGRTLLVQDRRQIAIVRSREEWFDEEGFDVYLPDGTYALRLATREIGHEGVALPVEDVPISAGRHRIAIRPSDAENVLRFTVFVDGQRAIEYSEDSERGFDHGYSSIVLYEDCEQLPPDEPAVLYRGRFGRIRETDTGYTVSYSDAPSNGFLLWIERAEGAR